MSKLRNSVGVVVFVALSSVAALAGAQSCPSGYGACDNGGCCKNSEQCCPNAAECCDSFTPYCCGDGTCAASPSECANPTEPTCSAYDIPCGPGCAPAGSDCCDSLGHYCATQGICTSALTCIAGTDVSAALTASPASVPGKADDARSVSPLKDPPDGSARSCAFRTPRGLDAERLSGLGMALGALALTATRRRGRRRPKSAAVPPVR
jgi:hypothetical protein